MSTPSNAGIAVSTAITAGDAGLSYNHAEGVIVATAITAGDAGLSYNHAEGVVVA